MAMLQVAGEIKVLRKEQIMAKEKMGKREEKLSGNKVKVVLARPHMHGGKEYKAGESIEVRPDQAIRLEKYGVIRRKGE